jgi:predicted DsbA family dithiol-disulfide isomerase
MFSEAGLEYTSQLDKVPNSRKALMLSELARDRGLHEAIHPRLFEAYWAQGLDIGDDDVLLAQGSAVGLDEDEMRAALNEHGYAERIAAQTTAATELGAGGVPAWVIDRRVLVPGAQPHEVFERIFERLGHQPLG